MRLPLLSLAVLMILLSFSCQNTPSEEVVEEPEIEIDSQLLRFEEEILAFEAEDQVVRRAPNGIVFTGSSSIRLWSTLAEDMVDLPAINRGFGGSTIPEVIHYADRIIFPYQPQLVVFYCGENDISDGISAEVVLERFQQFTTLIQDKLPNAELLFLSMKPSLDRWELWPEMTKGNQLIQQFIESKPKVSYLDIGTTMLNEQQEPDSTIFIEDGLHMNSEGYQRWTELVKPKVESLLQ